VFIFNTDGVEKKMNVVICKRCGFALGYCVCGKKEAVVLPSYKDNPKLLELLKEKEIIDNIL